MGKPVCANGREIAGKACPGKSIAAMPDPCLSPPPPPAGPVLLPYLVTATASDTSGGSKHVKIDGKEVMLRNRSYFKKCTGDEAATRTFGAGVVTHSLAGKVYFQVWSMDVKIEGQNAVRHLDLVTHNHMSQPGQTPPWLFAARAALAGGLAECEGEVAQAERACDPWKEKAKCPSQSGIQEAREAMLTAKGKFGKGKPEHKAAVAAWGHAYARLAEETQKSDCHKKLRCLLAPFKPGRCCMGQTGHHVVDASCFFDVGRGGENSTPRAGCTDYQTKKAPCICVEGTNNTIATHGMMHTFQGNSAIKSMRANGGPHVSFAQAKKQGSIAVKEVFPESGCSQACIEAQLDKYHTEQGIQEGTPLKGSASGRTSDAHVEAARSVRSGAASRR